MTARRFHFLGMLAVSLALLPQARADDPEPPEAREMLLELHDLLGILDAGTPAALKAAQETLARDIETLDAGSEKAATARARTGMEGRRRLLKRRARVLGDCQVRLEAGQANTEDLRRHGAPQEEIDRYLASVQRERTIVAATAEVEDLEEQRNYLLDLHEAWKADAGRARRIEADRRLVERMLERARLRLEVVREFARMTDQIDYMSREHALGRKRFDEEQEWLLKELERVTSDARREAGEREDRMYRLADRLAAAELRQPVAGIDVRDTPFWEGVQRLSKAMGVSIVFEGGDAKLGPITLPSGPIPFKDALDLLAAQTGCRWEYECGWAGSEIRLDPAARTLPSGLREIDLVEGFGGRPNSGDEIVAHYTGWLWGSFEKFDSSRGGDPLRFHVGKKEVIAGFDEGVRTLNTGGRRIIVIPPGLGYGDKGAGDVIPPGATLIFEVELVGVDWSSGDAGRQAIEERLDAQELTVHFDATPVTEVVQFLQEVTGLNIVLHPAAGKFPVTLRLELVPIRKVLDALGPGLEHQIFSQVILLYPQGKAPRPAPALPKNPEMWDQLSRPITVSFPDTPVDEAASFLHEITRSAVVITPAARQAMGEAKLDLRLKDVRLASLLSVLAEVLGITWHHDEDLPIIWFAARDEPIPPRIPDRFPLSKRLLTVNFPNVAVSDAVHFVSEVTGVPVRWEKEPPSGPALNIEVPELPADRILDILTHLAGLAWRLEGGEIVVSRRP